MNPGPEKPNILLLLADDFGFSDSPLYADEFDVTAIAEMPDLMGLATEGVRFSRFYTESTCSSSRASLLTGLNPIRSGFAPVARGLSPELTTLPEFLKQQGYRTHHTGKWHVGEFHQSAYPLQQGFDSSFGFLSQWLLKGPDKSGKVRLRKPTYKDPWLQDESGELQQYKGHLTDILTEKTVSVILDSKSSAQPWFIYHAWMTPHRPIEPASRFITGNNKTKAGDYRAQLQHLDESLGRILDSLKDTGQWDDTIIIFASDNGAKGKWVDSNAPFSGQKGSYAEGGIRVPLVVKWQGQSHANTIRHDVVSIMDIFPSLARELDVASNPVVDGLPRLHQPMQSLLVHQTFDGLSVLGPDGNLRYTSSLEGNRLAEPSVMHYENGRVSDSGGLAKAGDHLLQEYLGFRREAKQLAVTRDESRVTGSSFLRTPMSRAWSMAFSFTPQVSGKNKSPQPLVRQGDFFSVDYIPATSKVMVSIHGLTLELAGVNKNTCNSLVLSGEFYDWSSTVRKGILPSRLHGYLNGDIEAHTNGAIQSLEKIDILEPTVLGAVDNGLMFNGQIENVQFFTTQTLPEKGVYEKDFREVVAGLCENHD